MRIKLQMTTIFGHQKYWLLFFIPAYAVVSVESKHIFVFLKVQKIVV